MSKYSKSGKRSQSGAGNHFDKLLKVCSNSKVAGSLGRFGVASFTSLRSTPNEVQEPEKKPKSKYASFKKRARLDPSVNKAVVDTSSFNPLLAHPPPPPPPVAGSSSLAPATTVLKPRKFFKSRGPMEVEVGPNQVSKPFNSLVPLLPPLPPNTSVSPLIPAKLNTNTQYYNDQNQSHENVVRKGKQKKHGAKSNKKLENFSIPPPLAQPTKPSQQQESSFNSVCSPPIKLRIFKDRGKFVAQTPVTPVLPSESEPQSGKKRGRKARKSNSEDDPKPPKAVKRAKVATAPPLPPPPRPSGRTTRNSARRMAPDATDDMPSLDRELRHSISSIDGGIDNVTGDMYPPPPATLMVNTCELEMQQHVPPPDGDMMKKLEEDADFKKLSEMLSSMENDPGAGTDSYQMSQQHLQQQSTQGYENSQQAYQQVHQQGSIDNFASSCANSSSVSQVPAGLSAFAAQAYIQQQFRQQMQQQDHQHHAMNQQEQHNFYPPSSQSNIDNMNFQQQNQSQSQQQHMTSGLPQQDSLPKANDIRSILVDDWTDIDEEQQHSPRKPSSQSQSPPKVSRFDMSAFMGTREQSSVAGFPTSMDPTSMGGHHAEIERDGSISNVVPPRQMDYPEVDTDNQQQHLPQMPFNIHSSPLAVRNLIHTSGGAAADQGSHYESQSMHHQHQQSHQQAIHFPTSCMEQQVPLNSLSTCDKQAAISALDSVLKRQEMSSESQGSNFSNSQGSNSQGSQKNQQAPSTRKASIFKSRANQNANGESSATQGSSGSAKSSSKRLALYRHKFGQDDTTEEKVAGLQHQVAVNNVIDEFDDDFGEGEDEHDLSLRKLKVDNNSSGGYFSQWSGPGDDDGVTKVTCKKEAKRLFTVVRNVKAVHELQESGEFHEFDGDVQYILEDLRSKNPMNIRCLSAITLATRCMEPSFRMHLRAHGTVAEFCRELHDSPQHPELALLAALVLFVLSQDRLNMDLDTDTLKLILALSKADDCSGDQDQQQSQSESLETLKHHQKVLDLCVEMKDRGHATHLKLDRITASELALETLLHLTSKRAGEWVKHELRSLGGLDSIVNEVDSSLRFVQVELEQFGWTEGVIERLRKIDRCLQVLQQVTFNHEHNQKYLLGMSEREVQVASGSLSTVKCVQSSPTIFVALFRFCKTNLLQLHKDLGSAAVMREILFSVLRVLVNLSHDYRGIVLGSEILLAMNGFLQLVLHSTFEMGHYFPDEKIFDLLMHSLCMLLNLVEHSRLCRNAILSSTVQKSSAGNYRVPDSCGNMSLSSSSDDSGVDEEIPVLDAFVEMFLCRERAAKKEEQHTDNILTKGPDDSSNRDSADSSEKVDSEGNGGAGSQDKNSQDQEGSSLQDTIDKLIQTAGKHMENSLIAAYISLLLAYLMMDNPVAQSQVRSSMPNGKYLPLMIFLKKLFNFMSITSSASGSIRGLKATAIALRFFAQNDPSSDEELKKLIPD